MTCTNTFVLHSNLFFFHESENRIFTFSLHFFCFRGGRKGKPVCIRPPRKQKKCKKNVKSWISEIAKFNALECEKIATRCLSSPESTLLDVFFFLTSPESTLPHFFYFFSRICRKCSPALFLHFFWF